MKKSFLILIIAAFCSWSYSQTVSLDFLNDTINYAFNSPEKTIHELNPNLNFENFDKGISCESSYTASNAHTYPIHVMLYFQDNKLDMVNLLIEYDISNEDYQSLYNDFTTMLGNPYKTDIKGLMNEEPLKAYSMIKDGTYKFYHLYKKNNMIFQLRAEGSVGLNMVMLQIKNYI